MSRKAANLPDAPNKKERPWRHVKVDPEVGEMVRKVTALLGCGHQEWVTAVIMREGQSVLEREAKKILADK